MEDYSAMYCIESRDGYSHYKVDPEKLRMPHGWVKHSPFHCFCCCFCLQILITGGFIVAAIVTKSEVFKWLFVLSVFWFGFNIAYGILNCIISRYCDCPKDNKVVQDLSPYYLKEKPAKKELKKHMKIPMKHGANEKEMYTKNKKDFSKN